MVRHSLRSIEDHLYLFNVDVSSNVPSFMYIDPYVMWDGWGPSVLYIRHPPPQVEGFGTL